MPRSASTWSFNVVTGLLRAKVTAAHLVYGAYNEKTAEFLRTVPDIALHAVVKSHSLDSVGHALARIGAAKIVYTWREPADAIASFMRMFEVNFEHAFAVTEDSLRLYRFHRETGNAIILDYDEVISDPLSAIQMIADYLGLRSSRGTCETIASGTSLKRMRERVAQLGSFEESGRLVKFGTVTYDPETLLNLNHIRDGRPGYGAAVLTSAQMQRTERLSREYGLIG